ncbi:hypothetical protein [Flavobacterium sp. HNIBRBA15423]|uniref:hypothetical protein n=1 Tax=Flavobacterium sp. HNIBRBA15423 TaxID=3458683 RepID=UPI004044B56D
MILKKLILICFIISSCVNNRVVTNELKSFCNIYESEFNILNLSSNDEDLCNLELNSFLEYKYEYDILFHYQKEGSEEYYLDRFFFEKGKWMHTRIIDNVLIKNNVTTDNINLNGLLNKIDNKSYIQTCKDCNECENYTFLIKSDNKKFKYISNNYFLENLNEIDSKKISIYLEIYNNIKNK